MTSNLVEALTQRFTTVHQDGEPTERAMVWAFPNTPTVCYIAWLEPEETYSCGEYLNQHEAQVEWLAMACYDLSSEAWAQPVSILMGTDADEYVYELLRLAAKLADLSTEILVV
jgi:hypothetical protein